MNKKQYIDLHTHTTYSDGLLTPKELLERAKRYDLAAISITDHDTVSAYTSDTFDIAHRLEVELIPGIEFSTKDPHGHKYHILGLLIDVNNQDLLDLTRKIKDQRIAYTRQVCDLLIKAGWVIDTDTLLSYQGTITKAHIARAVVSNPDNHRLLVDTFGGHIPKEGEFIEATMIKGKPYYIKQSEELSPEVAIRTIKGAGGLAILAHPSFNLMMGEQFDELCQKFVRMGIDGFEAINVQYDRSHKDAEVEHIEQFINFSLQHKLVISGGSDFHHDDEATLGKFIDLGFKNHPRKVPYYVLEQLKTAKNQS
jgi:predicted metal-dependent phosphoesterase TrpH